MPLAFHAGGVCTTDLSAADCQEVQDNIWLGLDQVCGALPFCCPYATPKGGITHKCAAGCDCVNSTQCGEDANKKQYICPVGEPECNPFLWVAHLPVHVHEQLKAC